MVRVVRAGTALAGAVLLTSERGDVSAELLFAAMRLELATPCRGP